MSYQNNTKINQLEITQEGQHVKYGEGKDSYEGYKHEAYYHEVGKRDKYIEFHNNESMAAGIYDVIIETSWVKGQLKPRITYVPNQHCTTEYKKVS